MFLGHFGLALTMKRVAPRPSLGTTIMAAQWADGIWPVFVLLGLERVHIAPGITAVTPLDFVSYPYSHSLLADLVWAALFAVAYAAYARTGAAPYGWRCSCCRTGCWTSSRIAPTCRRGRVGRSSASACGTRCPRH